MTGRLMLMRTRPRTGSGSNWDWSVRSSVVLMTLTMGLGTRLPVSAGLPPDHPGADVFDDWISDHEPD